MNSIEIISGGAENLDKIEFLWEKLKEHHHDLSEHFKERFYRMTWQTRKENLMKKCAGDKMLVEYAVHSSDNRIVGYCISGIDREDEKCGEIESLYVEEEFRKNGLGYRFMQRAMNWLDKYDVEKQKILVAAGNDNALGFYR